MAGVAGSFAISALGYPKTGIRTFDFRMLIALVLFFAFGFLCTIVLGNFTPRQMGAFWPIYFMLLYIIAGLWVGHAFVAIGLSISALALSAISTSVTGSTLDGLCRRRRADARRPMDAPELTHGRARRHHPSAAAAANHGGAERAAGSAGLEFSRLKKLTGATDGNLGAHIETLSKAGYVAVEKAFVGKKPQTTVTATAAGRGAFARHVATLQEIIAGAGGSH